MQNGSHFLHYHNFYGLRKDAGFKIGHEIKTGGGTTVLIFNGETISNCI